MGSERRRQQDQNPTIKGGRITRAVAVKPRSNLNSNIHTLPNAEEEESGLHNTHLDFDHAKHPPSQAPEKHLFVPSTCGSRLGSNVSDASSHSRQAAPIASRAPASPLKNEPQQKVSRLDDLGRAMNPFQALAEGVKKSSIQLPHLHVPLKKEIMPEAKEVATGSTLPPHLRAPNKIFPVPEAKKIPTSGSLPPHMRGPLGNKTTPEVKEVPKSTTPPPHMRAPIRHTTMSESKKVAISATLPPHIRAASSIVSSQGSQSSVDARASHLRDSSKTSPKQTDKLIQEGSTLSEAKLFLPALEDQASDPPVTVNLGMPMNAGIKNKSAASDSAFLCSFPSCDRGFSRAKDLKRHKNAEHDWCSICDVDCEDDVALVKHRIASTLLEEGKHNACLKCGEDFGCEAGVNRHTQLMHREVQEISCPGCGATFERAARLLAHISNNRCKDRSGLVSSAELSQGRVDAVLEMERLANVKPFTIEDGSVDDSATNYTGGVPVTKSILDRQEEVEQGFGGSNENDLDDNMSVVLSANGASDAASDNPDAEAQQKKNRLDNPHRSNGKASRPGCNGTIEGLDKLSIGDGKKIATSHGWAKNLFPDAKATPVKDGWTQPKAQPSVLRGGRGAYNRTPSRSIIDGHLVHTDWDYFIFQRDPSRKFKCPFQHCNYTYVDEAAVKKHLISGEHPGTVQQCVKCFKRFKSSIALLAHMESPSLKCSVRDSEQYAQVLYMVSGGFIDINDDEKGITLADGQHRMRARTRAELAEQQAKREEERRERERQRETQW